MLTYSLILISIVTTPTVSGARFIKEDTVLARGLSQTLCNAKINNSVKIKYNDDMILTNVLSCRSE